MHRFISWTAVIAWMLVIFSLSAQVAEESNRLSTDVTEAVVRTVEKVKPDAEINVIRLNQIIRKNAHFLCYLVLGILAMNAFRRNGCSIGKSLILSFFLCAVYAVSDEIHQLYVPGRGAQVADVLIDCTGGVTGMFIYWFAGKIFYLIRTGKKTMFQVQAND